MKLLLLSLFLFIAGCQSEPAAVSDPQGQGNMSGEAEASSDLFTAFLAESMPTWRVVAESEWLAPEYVEMYNAIDAISEKISYESEIMIEADLNGDDLADYAAFLIDAENNVVLWAFHQTAEGFDRIEIEPQWMVEGCCLGVGIGVQNPGQVSGIELHSNGIRYKVYEKSETLFYYDGSAYQSTIVSD